MKVQVHDCIAFVVWFYVGVGFILATRIITGVSTPWGLAAFVAVSFGLCAVQRLRTLQKRMEA